MKKILMGIIVLLAVLAGYVAIQPEDFGVSRTAMIPAPAPAVFEQVNNLRNWHAWSPWARLDPNAKETFEGPEAGTGASMAWAGNSDVGEGKMTITESRLNEYVAFRLDFIKPFEATNTAEFTFEPKGNETMVTWSMQGRKDFMGKAMGLVFNCQKMVGDQFEQGFENLKAVLQKQ